MDPNVFDESGRWYIYKLNAVRQIDVHVQSKLISHRILLKLGKITNGTFPLVIAIIMDTPHCNKIVELLINAGADINIVDKDKLTPLGYAIDLGKICSFSSTLAFK